MPVSPLLLSPTPTSVKSPVFLKHCARGVDGRAGSPNRIQFCYQGLDQNPEQLPSPVPAPPGTCTAAVPALNAVVLHAVASPLVAVGEAGGTGALGPGLAAAALAATVLALRFAAYTRLEYIKAAMLSKYVPKGVARMQCGCRGNSRRRLARCRQHGVPQHGV